MLERAAAGKKKNTPRDQSLGVVSACPTVKHTRLHHCGAQGHNVPPRSRSKMSLAAC